ncbi:MAG: transcriptional regulator [Betaproteobacteria bacterium]|uniref:Transcriptional regulator n=1 Tax=Candidatus Proximibacter danicus TaxID=2954365 RepID=A0A9D7JY77_9PROT|nr:transcriptional regulator [Candidatus Proximibacter danicus]MBK9445504.1 transcriptional regulator [Betaproteobacteria bacterium]
MKINLIHSEADYQAALARIESLWDAEDGSAAAEQLEVLAMLVEAYEKAHHPIKAPDPIDFLHYIMETRGLTRKDMEPCIGPRGRVSDILNRVRPLTLDMIRRLSLEMNLPAEVLIQDYPLRREAA